MYIKGGESRYKNNLPFPKNTSSMNPVKQAELEWILSVLKRSQMNVSNAARELNMSRSTLYRKLKNMGYNIKESN
ncbi:hypothetical protein GNT69_20480 [Bacillus sp. B15-48]|nr:hypothetical protein [Bacillus sp. B15-48]